jgi:hypothetical protein
LTPGRNEFLKKTNPKTISTPIKVDLIQKLNVCLFQASPRPVLIKINGDYHPSTRVTWVQKPTRDDIKDPGFDQSFGARVAGTGPEAV